MKSGFVLHLEVLPGTILSQAKQEAIAISFRLGVNIAFTFNNNAYTINIASIKAMESTPNE